MYWRRDIPRAYFFVSTSAGIELRPFLAEQALALDVVEQAIAGEQANSRGDPRQVTWGENHACRKSRKRALPGLPGTTCRRDIYA